MSETTTKPRWLRRGATALAGLSLLLATAVGLSANSVAARGDRRAQRSSFGNGAGGDAGPPNDYPVPGIDYPTGPTGLQPPAVGILKTSPQLAPGSIFIAPKPGVGTTTLSGQEGPEIVDNEGRPIYFQPINPPYTATDFRVQQYRGQPVLTYDVGQSTGGPGHSEGEDVILNSHYQQIATVSAGNGLKADQHEFDLTPQGTALITSYHQVPYDLSSVGVRAMAPSSTASLRRSTSQPAKSFSNGTVSTMFRSVTATRRCRAVRPRRMTISTSTRSTSIPTATC